MLGFKSIFWTQNSLVAFWSRTLIVLMPDRLTWGLVGIVLLRRAKGKTTFRHDDLAYNAHLSMSSGAQAMMTLCCYQKFVFYLLGCLVV